MQQFADKDGGKWSIELTIGDVMRVRSATDGVVDLFDSQKKVDGSALLQDAMCDPVFFWETLWHLIEPQAESKGITATLFGKSMEPDCLLNAQQKFFLEWRDFFQKLQRPDAAMALEKMTEVRAKAVEILNAGLKNPKLATLTARAEAKMQKQLNNWLGSLEDSLDSMLDDSPSAKST